MALPFHDRIHQTVPDAMHTITDTVEKLLYLIIGKKIHTYFATIIMHTFREIRATTEWKNYEVRN